MPEPRAPRPERAGARPVSAALHEAEVLLRQNQPIDARLRLSRALSTAPPADRSEIRRTLGELNQRLVFSPEIVPGDDYARGYVLQSGDSLSKVVDRMSLHIDWRFLARVNGIPLERAHLVRAGDTIKIVTGPFHAIVDKSDHRLDLYLGDIGDPDKVFVRSFQVGLGEHNKTPVGRFRVRRNSKLINPEWIHPHTRERFAPDDPLNPIGERWIGLEGIDEATRAMHGYGIHGTIDPDSIGRNESMGCVRLRPDDVNVIYEVMMEGVSVVQIVE